MKAKTGFVVLLFDFFAENHIDGTREVTMIIMLSEKQEHKQKGDIYANTRIMTLSCCKRYIT
jgi:hypothetical protein